jgi:hypothetical protein
MALFDAIGKGILGFHNLAQSARDQLAGVDTPYAYGPMPDGSVMMNGMTTSTFTNPTPEYQSAYDWWNLLMNVEDQAIRTQQQFNQTSAQKAMDFSASEAQKNRDWQEFMSNTAYQRAMTDLRKAGLNPILAYTQGSASTPAGSTGSGYSTSSAKAEYNKENIAKDIIQMLNNTAVEYARINGQTLAGLINGIGQIIPF